MLSKVKYYGSLASFLLVTVLSNAQKATPAAERLKSFEQRKALEKASVINHVKFRNIGPTVMSGRVSDIEANPNDPTEFYVAYSSGACGIPQTMGFPSTPFLTVLIF